MELSPVDMVIPFDCFCGVGEVWNGDYDSTRITMQGRPVVVDIGANCGAFALYAAWKWNASRVICFEPNPTLFPYLQHNCETYHRFKPECEFELHNVAVGDAMLNKLYVSTNRLCASQYKPSGVLKAEYDIEVISPSSLPPCNILKIDAEGSECFICDWMTIEPDYLAVEYHTGASFANLGFTLLTEMHLIDHKFGTGTTGILKFVKAHPKSSPSPLSPPPESSPLHSASVPHIDHARP